MVCRRDPHNSAIENDIIERLTQYRLAMREQGHPEHGYSADNPFSQSAIAKKIGITKQCLCRWENGASYPMALATYVRWVRALTFKGKFRVELELPDDCVEQDRPRVGARHPLDWVHRCHGGLA